MPLDDFEMTPDDGEPVELYEFWGEGFYIRQTTSLDPVVVGPDTYEPAPIARSGTTAQSELAADSSMTIEVSPSHPIARMHLLGVPTGKVHVRVRELQRQDGDQDLVGVYRGTVRSGASQGRIVVLNCTGIPGGLGVSGLPHGWQRTCDYQLYDEHTCKVDRPSFTLTGVATLVDGLTVEAAVFGTVPSGWLFGGIALVGGVPGLITGHDGTEITLLLPFADLRPGDEILASAACDRLRNTCRDKFNNLANHAGNPWMPIKNPFEVGLDG